MITCRELIDFLADYTDGSLEPVERQAFDEHLAICPDCQEYVESYRWTIGLERAALCDDLEHLPPIPSSVVSAILAARKH
jgi:anti-sigma factor RsiW